MALQGFQYTRTATRKDGTVTSVRPAPAPAPAPVPVPHPQPYPPPSTHHRRFQPTYHTRGLKDLGQEGLCISGN